jgi:hypothetical protein
LMPRRSAAAAAVRSPRPGPSPPGPSPGSRPLVRSPGPALTPPRHGCRSWCPTCPSVPASQLLCSAGSPDPRQRPFRPGQPPLSGRLCGTTGGGASSRSRFPAAFRPPAFASRVFLRPLGDCAFLTVGLPARTSCRAPSGLSRSAWSRCGRGGCRLDPGDGGSLPAGRWTPASICRLPAAVPVLPPPAFRLREST